MTIGSKVAEGKNVLILANIHSCSFFFLVFLGLFLSPSPSCQPSPVCSQASKLLASSKSRYQDAASITASCFKLNSLQIGTLLRQYRCRDNEPPMLAGLSEQLVLMAENTIDEMLHSEDRAVRKTIAFDHDLFERVRRRVRAMKCRKTE